MSLAEQLSLMPRWPALLGFVLPLPIWAAEVIEVPSGQVVTLLEAVSTVPGNNGPALRFRFLAPAIARDGGTIDADTAGTDMNHLCNDFALKHLPQGGSRPAEIIISLSDRDVPLGEDNPEATQFFISYRIEDGVCQLEMF
jgi:hypothetical protein